MNQISATGEERVVELMGETIRTYKGHAKAIKRVRGMRQQLETKQGSAKVENFHRNLISETRTTTNSEASWRSRRIVSDANHLQL